MEGRATLADYVWWYPAEIAFAAFGWVVMNVPLIVAALLPLAPIVFFVWLLWLVVGR